jgi:hypothetical protein
MRFLPVTESAVGGGVVIDGMGQCRVAECVRLAIAVEVEFKPAPFGETKAKGCGTRCFEGKACCFLNRILTAEEAI